ncbi:MAG: acetylornithine deacetylase/succinyl-diaminopimelate desuccinylase-like protein [Planctomycetota bacterium]|jgi:acetylornithine deacetylase/succinyl-diaminopimelate desuccinylase-like protein
MTTATLDPHALLAHVKNNWKTSILPTLSDFIRIPAKSPAFDKDWNANGYLHQAVELAAEWSRARQLVGATVDVVQLEGLTPTLFVDVPAFGEGASDATVLMYGHLDKQPEVTGWDDNKGPWKPVVEDGKLYGRGAADDGYAVFGSLGALEALQAEGVAHPRCVVLIETSEESGSPDLAAYVEHLSARIGTPSLVVCLDSGAGDYERMWLCTSLRGNVTGDLRVSTVTEGIHSGDASGIVPSSFRVTRQILDRIEDAATGEILVEELRAEVPPDRRAQAEAAAGVLGEGVHSKYPFQPGTEPMGENAVDRILARTWVPTLSVTGADGLPAIADAGNVLRPETALKLSFRLAPTTNPDVAITAVTKALVEDAPSRAKVRFENVDGATGWNAPPFAPWLDSAIQESSEAFFGKPAVSLGEGGTIPLMGLLGESFPEAQFVITGVLGPGSNAHGPNEFLHLEMAERLTACVAWIVAKV